MGFCYCCKDLLLVTSLFTCTGGSWTDPSRDVVINSQCDPSSVSPAIENPKDATELHPAHFKYALAIGDSITAAALAKGGPLEYRQISWSGGSGGPDSYTMPYLVRQYSRSLIGPARGNFQWDQLGPCCGKAPWWSGIEGANNQLNAALSGQLARDWKLETDHLTNLVSGKGFGKAGFGGFPKWNQDEQAHYRQSWKILTVFLGMNDVLTTPDACSGEEWKRSAIVDGYARHMNDLFDHLAADKDGVFKNVYINLVMLFRTSYMGLQNTQQGWCKLSGDTFLKSEFPCMRNGGDVEAKGALVDKVTSQMNDVLVEIARKYDQIRPDFAVNLVQTLANQQITHEDLRSSIDCFHPTAKAHRILGVGLWNAMLKPSYPQAIDDLQRMPDCIDNHTRLVTYNRVSGVIV
mmetsp:Transcript_111536/g.197557  ORF Transcript_111536/g.197557 Transcript_111536/m.197557 type:complete len:406 (-) Transcript_111536:294-1511(-)